MTTSDTWLIDPRGVHPARLVPPASKSDAQRSLVLARVLEDPRLAAFLREPSEPFAHDIRVLDEGLSRLGVETPEVVDIDCADGGVPFRFLLTQAAVTPHRRVRFHGSERLGQRPHRPLLDALRATLGASGLSLREGDGFWPVSLETGPRVTSDEPVFRVGGVESSQFASSLLLGAALLERRERRAWSVALEGDVASSGYLDLTIAWLRRSGFDLRQRGGEFTLAGWSAPANDPRVPGDWSSIGYLLAIAWRTRGSVANVDASAAHPDQAVVAILESIGLRVAIDAAGDARVDGSATGGIRVSGAPCPDLLPTLAALACVLPGRSEFSDTDILRHKESDRLEGIRDLVAAAGGVTSLDGAGTLRIEPPWHVSESFEIDSRHDHRRAMSAATLAVLSGSRVRLHGASCVAKSFPGFWSQLEAAGVRAGPA